MTDEQDGLRAGDQLVLQPAFGRDVQVVVGLVQEEHFLGSAQQRFEHDTLLLTAGQGGDLAPLRLLERHSQRGDRAHVGVCLPVVATDVGPVRQGLRIGHLVGLTVALHHAEFGGVDRTGGQAHRVRGHGEQEVAHSRVVANVADELTHDGQTTTARHRSLVGRQITGDDPSQGRLARAVRPDEGDLGALADPQMDITQQRPPIGQAETHAVDVDVSHEKRLSGVCRGLSKRFPSLRPALWLVCRPLAGRKGGHVGRAANAWRAPRLRGRRAARPAGSRPPPATVRGRASPSPAHLVCRPPSPPREIPPRVVLTDGHHRPDEGANHAVAEGIRDDPALHDTVLAPHPRVVDQGPDRGRTLALLAEGREIASPSSVEAAAVMASASSRSRTTTVSRRRTGSSAAGSSHRR